MQFNINSHHEEVGGGVRLGGDQSAGAGSGCSSGIFHEQPCAAAQERGSPGANAVVVWMAEPHR